MTEADANSKLVPIIINSVDGWDMKFQIEGAKSFAIGAQKALLSQEHGDTIMAIGGGYIKGNIDYIQNEEDNEDSIESEYINSYLKLFIELSGSISKDGLKTDVMKTIKMLIDFKKPIVVRKTAVRLIVEMSLKYQEDKIIDYFKDLILYGGQDLNWNIRLAICEEIPRIGNKLSNDNSLEILYPEVVEFLNDAEILVRLAAIETTLEIFGILDDEKVQNDFLPVVKMHLNVDLDETCTFRMSRIIGKIIFNLQNSFEDMESINSLGIDYFKDLTEIDKQEIKINVGFNIPGLYYMLNGQDVDFRDDINRYATDKDQTVRLQIARGFHEIVSINTKVKGDSLEFKQIFFKLLEDDSLEIQYEIIKNLDEYLFNFFPITSSNEWDPFDISIENDMTPNSRGSAGTDDDSENPRSEFFLDCIELLLNLEDKLSKELQKTKDSKNLSVWKIRQTLYSKLIKLFHVFPQESIKEAFYPLAKDHFCHGVEPLRHIGAVFIAKTIYSEYLTECRESLLSSIVEELENGTFNQRRCLLEFYEHSLETFSKKFWTENGYKGFIKLSEDKIPIMRIRFCKSAINIWKRLTRHDSDISFIDTIENLIEDMDEDVQEAAIRLNTGVMNGYDDSKEAQLEEEEKLKINYESILKEREIKEQERLQKKLDEEKEKKEYMEMLTEQMRMKKRYLKIPGFQAKVFTKETPGNKTRSRKRGSFTAGSRSKTSKSRATKSKSISNSSGKIGSHTPNGQSRSLSFSSKSK